MSFKHITSRDNAIFKQLKKLAENARERGKENKTLLDGVDLTERDLLKKLESHGVRKLSPEGQKFDPNLHQAMFEIPDETKPNGTVMQVVQAGYVIGERVLRPAMVGVSKGGPKATPGDGVNKTA